MNFLTLTPENRATLADWFKDGTTVTACLCAAWCDTCNSYQEKFAELASQNPDQRFAWIDIEDRADLVGDLDIDNFPTLLIQRGDTVCFFGTVLPDAKLAERLLQAQLAKSDAELEREIEASEDKQEWQEICNLKQRLAGGQA